MNQNYYVLKKGILKVTEYDPNTNPYETNLDNKVVKVGYVSQEGHGFLGDITNINNSLQPTSVQAIDEDVELYMLTSAKREKILNNTQEVESSSIVSNPQEFHQLKDQSKDMFPSRNTYDFDSGI